MPLQPHELDSETEITYWRDRVASLEALVGELLAKNQGLRALLKSAMPKASSASVSEANKSVCENGDSSRAGPNSSF
jgi:phage shock protein A